MPGVALRTTFIVGFPGETDADVDELCRFVEAHAFDHVGVFTYSHEEGHVGVHGSPTMCRPAASKRGGSGVMRLQKQLVRRRQRARIGQRVRVMVDGPPPTMSWC